MLEGDHPGSEAFALYLRTHHEAFRQLMCPYLSNLPIFFKNANAWELAPVGGGGMGTARIR